MLNIINAFRALKKRWIITILIIIQFTLGLSVITGSVNLYYNLYYLNNNSNSVLDLNSTYLITSQMINNSLESNKSNKDEISEVYKSIATNKDVIGVGTYSEDSILIDNSSSSKNKELINSLKNPLMNGSNMPFLRTISIDEHYYKLLDIYIKSGKGFSSSDFRHDREEKTSILLGSYFKKYFKIGDIINNQYTVIGFFPKNKFIVNNNTTNTYIKLDKAAIVPMPLDIQENYEAMLNRLHIGTILKLKEGANIEDINKTIQLKSGDTSLYLKNLGQDINDNTKNAGYTEIPIVVLSLSFIVFSITGIIVTTISSILIRRREFGIKLALGESIQGIFNQIFLENALVSITALVLALIYFYFKYKKLILLSKAVNNASVLDFKLNLPILFIVFLFMCLIMVVSNFIIFLFIRKLQPKDLIGGME